MTEMERSGIEVHGGLEVRSGIEVHGGLEVRSGIEVHGGLTGCNPNSNPNIKGRWDQPL
ncbi:hypothetical protein [Hungatella effluvii]|uniref:hypothetical protein n=1 Tax=Hungatella effluvii TaxID=1096246 RepID=UPI001A9A375D|nr:hypothetical protein [Hungatella effluvii]